jgi:general secretion pathway protein G
MTIRARRAFTLIELLMVMVVIAVLAAIVIPKFMDRGKQAKEAALKSDLKILRNAIAAFQADNGCAPLTLSDLTVTSAANLSTANTGVDSSGNNFTITAGAWHGPYVQTVPNDPVANAAFTYSTTAGTVGNISSSASGNGLDGNAYSTY